LLAGKIVEFHSLVDLERGWTERFPGGSGGADILATVALDAGVGVEEARPGEVFEFVRTDVWGFRFCLGLEVDGDWRKNAGREFAGDEVFGWSAEDVDVLGVRKVGEEEEDGAECSPVAEDAEGFGIGRVEEVGESGGEGLE
jgi:hypothetical protein